MKLSTKSTLVLLTLASGAAAVHAQSTLDKVKSSGSITVAYREASIPFSYLGGDGKPVGFGWEICGRIVDQVKRATGRNDLTVKTQAVTSQNRIPLMVNGTIDIECGSTTNNSDRAKQVSFAINYFYTGTRLMVKANSPIKTFADLKGRKVVSTTGTTNFQVLRKYNADNGTNVEVLGWDPKKQKGLFTENFESLDDGLAVLVRKRRRHRNFGGDDALGIGHAKPQVLVLAGAPEFQRMSDGRRTKVTLHKEGGAPQEVHFGGALFDQFRQHGCGHLAGQAQRLTLR